MPAWPAGLRGGGADGRGLEGAQRFVGNGKTFGIAMPAASARLSVRPVFPVDLNRMRR